MSGAHYYFWNLRRQHPHSLSLEMVLCKYIISVTNTQCTGTSEYYMRLTSHSHPSVEISVFDILIDDLILSDVV